MHEKNIGDSHPDIVDVDSVPLPTEEEVILLMHPDWMEQIRKYNGVYNQSVMLDWEDIDPAEDRPPTTP